MAIASHEKRVFQSIPESNFLFLIEEKQVAEQRALRAQNDLQRIVIEAEQVRAQAGGEAEAQLARARAEAEVQKMLRQTLTASVLQLRAIEKWDGVLPHVSAGESNVPFLGFGVGSLGGK